MIVLWGLQACTVGVQRTPDTATDHRAAVECDAEGAPAGPAFLPSLVVIWRDLVRAALVHAAHEAGRQRLLAEAERDALRARLEEQRLEFERLAARVAILEARRGGVAERRPGTGHELIHLWSTTCAPCVAELPDVIALARELKRRGVAISFVADEGEDSVEHAKRLFREAGSGFPLDVRTRGTRSVRTRMRAPGGTLPVTALVADRHVRFVREGVLSAADRARLVRCVEDAAAGGPCP